MSAIGPAEERIVRNLQDAVERLHEDIARIEMWADALGCFSRPVPEYNPGETHLQNFVLPKASSAAKPISGQRTNGNAGRGTASRRS